MSARRNTKTENGQRAFALVSLLGVLAVLLVVAVVAAHAVADARSFLDTLDQSIGGAL